jgi:hypothetical protein
MRLSVIVLAALFSLILVISAAPLANDQHQVEETGNGKTQTYESVANRTTNLDLSKGNDFLQSNQNSQNIDPNSKNGQTMSQMEQ